MLTGKRYISPIKNIIQSLWKGGKTDIIDMQVFNIRHDIFNQTGEYPEEAGWIIVVDKIGGIKNETIYNNVFINVFADNERNG